jgi:hypothetical protein
MPDNFLVIRIHPDSPVDGATFSTYLEELQIKVYLAGTYPGTPAHPAVLLGGTQVNAETLNLVAVPWMTGTYVASVSQQVAANTTESGTNFGTTLDVNEAAGIAFGSIPISPADSKMFAGKYDRDEHCGPGESHSIDDQSEHLGLGGAGHGGHPFSPPTDPEARTAMARRKLEAD